MITNVHVIARNDEQVKYLNELWLNSDFELNRKSACKSGFIGYVGHYPIVAYMGSDNLRFSWDYMETRTRNAGADIEFDEYKRRMDARKKPTRTECVKVDDSIFDLKPDLEAGELYSENSKGKMKLIENERRLFSLAGFNKGIYRKVEREITWQDELLVAISNGASIGEGSVRVGGADLTDEQFIELCHKVYHLTK